MATKRGRPPASVNTGSDFEAILDQLRQAFQAQYERGTEDAMHQILNLATGGGTKRGRGTPAKATREKRARAPRGTAKALVERVLSSGARTVRQITEGASSQAERLMSSSAV